MLHVLVLEDDAASRDALGCILKSMSDHVDVCAVSSLEEAEEALKKGIIFDLFLLDVNLDASKQEDVSGITFAKEIRKMYQYEMTPVVMITSVPGMELSAYRELHCYQYILKPFRQEAVQDVVKKVMAHPQEKPEQYLVVKREGVNYQIRCDEIVFCQAIPRGVCLCLKNERMNVSYLTIRQLLEKLPKEDFLQCHRMFVVNKEHVEYYDLVNQVIKMQGYPDMIDIGITYKQEVRRQIHG